MTVNLKSFNPPQRLLLGPGPSQVHPRVLAAMARPTIGHLDPEFIRMMEELKQGLRALFRTANTLTLPISGPATAGQQACIVNLLEPGDTYVSCINGVFGERLAVMAERAGATVVRLQQEWGRAFDPDVLRKALKAHPETKLVGFVHAETSTGALSDGKTLAGIARDAGCLVLADTVTSLGGVPVEIDSWGIDACYSGSQKCLSCPPGLGPITFGARAVQVINERKTPVQSWFLDLKLLLGYWDGGAGRSYHHTAPVNALYGLHEALVMLHEEGLENVWARHLRIHRAFVAGLEAMGLRLAVPVGERAAPINTVCIPEGVDDAVVRKHLLANHGIEISAGLGPMAGKIWRIGLMGQSAQESNLMTLLAALAEALAAAGAPVDGDAGRGAAESSLGIVAA